MALDHGINSAATLRPMATRIKPPDVQGAVAVMQAARARGRGRRSPLYLWFSDNYAELSAAFERNAPAWGELATYLGEHGLRDADGKPPTARGTRDAWYRVGKDKAAAPTRKVAKPTAAPPRPVAPSAPQPEPPAAQTADVQDILNRLGGTRARGGRLPNSVG